MFKIQSLVKMFSLIIVFVINFSVICIKCDKNESSLDNDEEKWYWNKEEYPNPYEQPPYCRRTKPSYVCDPDQILSRKQANLLDDLINSLKNVSICFCPYCPPNERGLSFAIAIMKNIHKEYNVRQLQNADNFAQFIREKWNFGICDNNVVIILVIDDDQVAFSQGSLTAKVFPQMLMEDVIKNNGIHFIQENYYQGLENILQSIGNILRKGIQYSEPFKENNSTGEDSENDESSHTGLIVGLIIGFILFVVFIIFLLIYLKRRFSEDMNNFQFKGMLSKGYWLNKNERLRPVSVSPINTVGGVYEPCSIEECNNTDADKRLRQKLSQISDESTSSDEEDIQVIEHKTQTPTHSDNANTSIEETTLSQPDLQTELSHQTNTKSDVNV